MDASAKSVSKILFSGDQFLIPFFQRNYKWRRKDWDRLWSDISVLLESPSGAKHFLGPLVCTALNQMPGEITAFQLIDGQQRLTTLTLILAAVRDVAAEIGATELASKVQENYLAHKYEKGLRRYKIVPRTGDREAFVDLIEQRSINDYEDYRLIRAYHFFRKHIGHVARNNGEEGIQRLFEAVTGGLYLVVISIDEENPYEIFESLNSTGLPLAESDLIRNFLFMQVLQDGQESQEDFHANHWEKYESLFDAKDDYAPIPATAFYRNFLMRNGEYSRATTTFVDFKSYHEQSGLTPQKQVEELAKFARHERFLRRPPTCDNAELKKRLSQTAMLEITTAYPLLLNLINRQATGSLTEEDLLGCIDDLASFVIRRSICGESTRRYGVWFCEAARAIKDNPRQDLRGYLLHRGWPDDNAFVAALKTFPLYRRESKKARIILEALEASFGHKEPVELAALSIEHVLPQTVGQGASGNKWKKMLGEDWKQVHEQWLHVLGNLTLTGYNESMSNRPFDEKRDALCGSHVSLNKYFTELRNWDEGAIKQRSQILAETVARLWTRPEKGPGYTPPATLGRFRGGKERRKAYWTQFAKVLNDQYSREITQSSTGETKLELDTGAKMASLWVWFKPRQKKLLVGISFRGCRGREIWESLKKDRVVIEQDLGFALDWQQKPSRMISTALSSVSLKDQLDWYDQHAWAAKRLVAFQDHLLPRIVELNSQLDAAKPSKEMYTREYWAEKIGDDLLSVCDGILEIVNQAADGSYNLKFNKYYIGLCRGKKAANVVWFRPRKKLVDVYSRPKSRGDWQQKFQQSRLKSDIVGRKGLRIRLTVDELVKHQTLIEEFIGEVISASPANVKGNTKERHLKFWTEFAERLEAEGERVAPQKPRAQPWMGFSIGRSRFWLVASADASRGLVSTGVAMGGKHADTYYDLLEADKEEIEQEMGQSLEWRKDTGKKSKRVYARLRDLDTRDPKTWPEAHAWLVKTLEAMHRVFSPRIKKLKLSEAEVAT